MVSAVPDVNGGADGTRTRALRAAGLSGEYRRRLIRAYCQAMASSIRFNKMNRISRKEILHTFIHRRLAKIYDHDHERQSSNQPNCYVSRG
jgi:hypothetical protein